MNLRFFLPCAAVLAMAFAPTTQAAPAKIPTAKERFGGKIATAESPSFRRHVVPLASKLGCSGRECHGSFQGRGDFRLSLFGYDFEKDHKAITADKEHRVRVNLEEPEKSLFIQKPTKQVAHKGGRRYDEESWEHNVFLKWIQQGAKLDVEATGVFDRLEVTPKEIVFSKPGETIALRVFAHWKDGTVEDVTQLSRFRTNDESVAEVSEDGAVKVLGKGDSHVVVFYDNGVHPVPVMLPVSAQHGAKYPKVAGRTKVDQLVIQKLRKVGILPADVCSDEEFLRRASLDITGTLPLPDEVRQFAADKRADKRARKIDDLLSRPSYAAWWATKLSDYTGNSAQQLRLNNIGNNLQTTLARQWYDWLNHRIANNVPYDKLIEGIVLATTRTKQGQTFEEMCKEMGGYFREKEPVSFAERENMPWFWSRQNLRMAEEKAMAFAYSFLGVRIQCAQCHKHPFDQWTQQDFQQFQAFFEPLRFAQQVRKEDGDFNYNKLTATIRSEANVDSNTTNPQNQIQRAATTRIKAGDPVPWQEVFVQAAPARRMTDRELEQIKRRNPNFAGRVITPKLLGGSEVMAAEFPDPRQPLMAWLKDKNNPYFGRAFVNRTWASYFGRGLVEPADDLNLANPPTNAELMDYLADGFVQSGYDMKWLHREILNSDTYQRSWKTNPTNLHDDKNFSHQVIRRLPAEVVADAMSLASASASKMEEFASNMEVRAIGPQSLGYNAPGQRRTGSSYMLNIFGKPARETNCDCERTSDPTLLQTIYTRNDPEMLGRLEQASRESGSWVDEVRHAAQSKTGTPAKPEQLVEEAFLRTLSRRPTAKEMEQGKADLAAAQETYLGVRDLLWALLNTKEFMVNH